MLSLNIPLQKPLGWFRRLSGMMQWVQQKKKKKEVWHKHFKGGWESVESDPHPGRTAISKTLENIESVQGAINKDWWLTVQELEADMRIRKTTVSEILMKDLGMKRVVAKFVLWLLLPEQKDHCAAVGRTEWSPKVPALKGTEAPSSYVQCFLYLVSS